MKVSYDFIANKFVETSENGIEIPMDDIFTILVIKAPYSNDNLANNYWLVTEKEEEEYKNFMINYYYKNSLSISKNPFNKDNDPDNYEQYEQELMYDPLIAIEELIIEEELFTMGDYKVSSVMYYHNNLDSNFFYKFKKLNNS